MSADEGARRDIREPHDTQESRAASGARPHRSGAGKGASKSSGKTGAKASGRGTAQPGPPGLAARDAATAILLKVVRDGSPLGPLLEAGGAPGFRALSAQDKGLVRAILDAALRHRGAIEDAIRKRLERPLDEKAHRLSALLHLGATQILYLDVPDHAAINLAVTAAGRDRRTAKTKGLVNSVLRRIARERGEILASAASVNGAPDWMIARWEKNWGPERTAAILAAHADAPPLDLTAKSDPAALAERLSGDLLPNGSIRLDRLHTVSKLPGYDSGDWWVQDAAASIPARLLGDISGKRVADLCAAPGGKTAQLAAAGALVTAVEKSASRMRRLKGNLERLRLSAEFAEADVFSFQPAESFDFILLDAPCSATGTIRRHPDLPWTKREDDIVTLRELQQKMLAQAANWLKPGGILVYATCSLEPEEGEEQAHIFTKSHDMFEPMPLKTAEFPELQDFSTPEGFFRSLPGMAFGGDLRGVDGFFAARWRRLN
ncbi:RsmB/NOP family class I SAM-dependent RNA methyltransferase [Afifella aestuarii]|uniref:RsmB/NOP family class I SAM-dependent RNA methyltransferase n=1 Tax=Afifella aestuarii TaxID=1909496 RepID=UPI000FE2F70E|nr:transcription antitermination factor NusB [Afifella aestuarii]